MILLIYVGFLNKFHIDFFVVSKVEDEIQFEF